MNVVGYILFGLVFIGFGLMGVGYAQLISQALRVGMSGLPRTDQTVRFHRRKAERLIGAGGFIGLGVLALLIILQLAQG